jgi:hypothetical protein
MKREGTAMEFDNITDALSHAKSLAIRHGGAFVAFGVQSFRDYGDYDFHYMASRPGGYVDMTRTYATTVASWVRA